MQGCVSNHAFHNWAQTITCKPATYCQPDTENDVSDIVRDAAAGNKHVRIAGAGHSWAPLALTRDVLVNLDRLNKSLIADVLNHRYTVQAGIRLKDLIPRLRQDGLGLANLGSITEQSVAGAISTGTHGTGLTLGSLGTQIVGMKLVKGNGDVVSITDQDPVRMNAARLSLGALGIITEVTIQCVADYNLELTAYWTKFDDIVDQMEAFAEQNVRAKFWWLIPPIGPKDIIIMTTENPVAATAAAGPQNAVLPMDTVGLLSSFLNLFDHSPGIHQFLKFQGPYDQILTIPLLPVLHRECEYAIPMGKTADALRAFKRVVDEQDLSLTLPVEVRYVAKDETLLSPANNQDVCYIGAASQPNANEVIERFEPIMKSFGGKPHWGKCFSLTRDEIEKMHVGYEQFRSIKNEFDPNGVFSNEFLRFAFD
jgi:FAD/FMN-containing dehydrogenase